MKRLKYLFVILSLFVITNVSAASVSSNVKYDECNEFADGYKTISRSLGKYDYKYCMRATCNDQGWVVTNMTYMSGYQCANGNNNPYTALNDGCSSYQGSCSSKGKSYYCTRIKTVDCTRTASGSIYVDPNTTTTTKATQGATTRTTTKAATTTKATTTIKTGENTTKIIITRTSKTSSTKTTKKRTSEPAETTTTTTEPTTTTVSNNANIKSIKIEGTDIKYSADKDTYDVQIAYKIKDVKVKVKTEDENATVEVVGNKDMTEEPGEVITIVVTAPGGEQKTVNINVTRYVKKSDNCNLASLKVNKYTLDFNKRKYDYKLKIAREEKELDIDVELDEPELQTYEIKGNANLKNKSKVNIKVTAEDDSVCNYVITIKKTSKVWSFILIIVILGGVLGVVVYFLLKIIRKGHGLYKYE